MGDFVRQQRNFGLGPRKSGNAESRRAIAKRDPQSERAMRAGRETRAQRSTLKGRVEIGRQRWCGKVARGQTCAFKFEALRRISQLAAHLHV